MSRFLNPAYSSLQAYVPGEQPRNMQQLIKINTNESPYPPAPGVAQAAAQAAQSLQLYNDPEAAALREALAQAYGVTAQNVCVGNGSDELLAFCFMAFCAKGAAFADITYGFYSVQTKLFGIPAQIIPLRDDFSLCVQDYASCEGAVFIANPNAPTGMALPLSDIEELLNQNRSRIVVVDEAYVDFGAQSAALLIGRYPNLVVMRTFSKSRNLAGGRLGFALADKALIDDLLLIKNSFHPYNVSALTQAAGLATLREEAYIKDCIAKVCGAREYTADALRQAGYTVLPSRANFLFAASPVMDGGELQKLLRQNNILVRWFGAPRTHRFVRISIGTLPQMQQVVKICTQSV